MIEGNLAKSEYDFTKLVVSFLIEGMSLLNHHLGEIGRVRSLEFDQINQLRTNTLPETNSISATENRPNPERMEMFSSNQ